ncbi:MAG TPA: signal peptidase I [Dehalococcoidia bacterium]|nr:signal peptidase I [Dehalococcoidia bacterium]
MRVAARLAETPAQAAPGDPLGPRSSRIARVGAGVLPWAWLLIVGWVIGIYFIIYFLLPRLPLSASGSVYVVQPALWMSLGLVGLLLWRWGLQDKPRLSAYLVAVGLLAGAFHVALLVLSGVLLGFGHSPYGDSPPVVAQNLLYVGSGVLGLELARAYLVAVFARRSGLAALAFVSLFLALVTIPKARFMDLGGGEGGFEVFGDTFLPTLSESVLASFLALLGGPLASIAYRGALEAFQWFSPILPDLSWSVAAFVGTLAPAIALLIVRGVAVPTPGAAEEAPSEGRRDSWVLFPSGVAIAAVSLLWLSTGLLGVRPALVAGQSMEPALRAGDVVLTREVSADDVGVGDIVRFTRGGTTILHRVKETYESGGTKWIVTKGDANNVNDNPITDDDIEGEVLLTIPKIGWVGIFVKNTMASGAAGSGGPVLLVWIGAGGSIILAAVAIAARKPGEGRRARAMAKLFGRWRRRTRPALTQASPVAVPRPPLPERAPPPQRAVTRRRRQTLAPALAAGAEAIGVAVAVVALWAAERGRARAIARLLGGPRRRTGQPAANERRLSAPAAPPVINDPAPPEPVSRPRPRRALALASLAGAQAIAVGVAVVALWATGSAFFGGSGACPNEPAAPVTDVGPRFTAPLDGSSLVCMAPVVAAAAVQPKGAPQAPLVAAATETPGAATEPPPVMAEPSPPATEPPAITPELAQPPPAAAPAGPTFEYQVQPGDTLFDIALRFGADVQALATLNGLSSAQVVWVGQVLQVPGTAPASPPTPAPAPTSTPSQPSVPTLEYTVRPGESLSDVAAFFGTTVEVIAALNSLANANLVVPGQRLLVPALPATTAPGREFMSEYVVQSGETLTDIAGRFGTTVEALAAANSLANPSAIRVGDHLLVP